MRVVVIPGWPGRTKTTIMHNEGNAWQRSQLQQQSCPQPDAVLRHNPQIGCQLRIDPRASSRTKINQASRDIRSY